MTEQPRTLPPYLNEHCLQCALEKSAQTSAIKLQNCHWQPANIVGGNYCSNIFSVNGSYENLDTQKVEQFHFIIKDVLMEVLEDGTNELAMYEQILPEMAKIIEKTQSNEINSKTSHKLAPSCFWTKSSEEHEFFILENLNTLDYKLGDRLKGLKVSEAQLTVKKLAKFHAASMVYAEQFPAVIASLKPAQFASEGSDEMAALIFEKGMACAMELFQNDNPEIVLKMKKLNTQFHARMKENVNPTQSVFNVLNHGDLWMNNILFKQLDGEEGDAIFVDFQHAFWGGPSFDLTLFLYTSLPLQILQTQRFELLSLYYKTLKAQLEVLNFQKIPTWADFQKEMQRGALLAYYTAIIEWPSCCMSDEAAAGFTVPAFRDGNEAVEKIYKTPEACEFVWHAVLHFEEIGLLDRYN